MNYLKLASNSAFFNAHFAFVNAHFYGHISTSCNFYIQMRKNYIFGIFSKRKLSFLLFIYQFPLDSFSNKKIYKIGGDQQEIEQRAT